MFFSRLTRQSTAAFSKQIDKLRAALDTSDAVVIGAGAGLSTAAGYTYSGERFKKLFGDFAARYGFTDMYSGGFYPYDPDLFGESGKIISCFLERTMIYCY